MRRPGQVDRCVWLPFGDVIDSACRQAFWEATFHSFCFDTLAVWASSTSLSSSESRDVHYIGFFLGPGVAGTRGDRNCFVSTELEQEWGTLSFHRKQSVVLSVAPACAAVRMQSESLLSSRPRTHS